MHPHSNLSCIGDRPHAHVDKILVLVHHMHRSCHCGSRSWHGHDPRVTHLVLEFASDVCVCVVLPHHNINTNVIAAACSSHVTSGVLVSACGDAGCAPDAENPPWETEGYGVESCAQRYFLLRLRLGRTETLALFSMPLIPGSLLACGSAASAQCTIDFSSAVRTQTSRLSTGLQFSSDMLRCELAVVLSSSQVPAFRTPFAETPLIEARCGMLAFDPLAYTTW